MIIFNNPRPGKGSPRQFRIFSGPFIAEDGLKTEYYVCINHNASYNKEFGKKTISLAARRCFRKYIWPTKDLPKEVVDQLNKLIIK